MESLWNIGISPWIIQDGNYDDFSKNRMAGFALEFYAEKGFVRAETGSVRVEHLRSSRYRVTAQVIHRTDDWWAIDFGLRAFQDAKAPDFVEVGSFVTGEIYLGIDPFFYFESLSKEDAAPALTHEWKISKIVQEVAPLRKSGDLLIPDEASKVTTEIEETDAWSEKTNVESLHYVFCCQPTGGPHLAHVAPTRSYR